MSPKKDLQGAAPTGMRQVITMRGRFIVERVDPAGRVVERFDDPMTHNTIVSVGQANLASFLATGAGAGSSWMSALAIGTGTAVPGTNDTNLNARTGNAITGNPTSPSAQVWQLTANFASSNPSGAATVQEAAIFSTTATNAVMWARQTFGAISKGASDNINLTYSVTFQAG